MSTAERIIRQVAPPQGVIATADDRYLTRWVFNMGAPISLAEWTMSRFVGEFPNDVLPTKRPIPFQRGYAQSVGIYEHPAFYGTGAQSDMLLNHADTTIDLPYAGGINPQTGKAYEAPLSRYNNNPKLCAYMLMRDNEKRGLVLFEELRGASDEEFMFLWDSIIPPEKEKEWSAVKRDVLGMEFQGPFLYQYQEWLGIGRGAPVEVWFKEKYGAKKTLQRKEQDRRSAMMTGLRDGAQRAARWYNSTLNNSEAQIREKRNGGHGKVFYDMPDERYFNPVPPLDLLALAETNRQPIDLQNLQAADAMAAKQNEGMIAAAEVVGEKIAAKMSSGVSAAEIDAIIERRLAARDAEWQRKIDELQRDDTKA